jgi:hypothetical protein
MHDFRSEELRESAAQGCRTCIALLDVFLKDAQAAEGRIYLELSPHSLIWAQIPAPNNTDTFLEIFTKEGQFLISYFIRISNHSRTLTHCPVRGFRGTVNVLHGSHVNYTFPPFLTKTSHYEFGRLTNC